MPISQEQLSGRRGRSAEGLRRQLREIAETLGARDLEKVTAFAEFVKARRTARSYAARGEGGAGPESEPAEPSSPSATPELGRKTEDEEPSPSSRKRTAAR
jgi:hypothetical protein